MEYKKKSKLNYKHVCLTRAVVEVTKVTLQGHSAFGPEEINICAVVDRQVHADASIEQLKIGRAHV